MTEDTKISLVLASDDKYAQHAAVAMASVLANAGSPERIQFFLIDDGISAEGKRRMQETTARWHSTVSFLTIRNKELEQGFVSGNLSRTAYFRLDIPDIVPPDVTRVIYLDCDLLVLQDVRELWEWDLEGKPVGATEDFGILTSAGKRRGKTESFGWQPSLSYFNSGVLLLDVAQWRTQDYGARLRALLAKQQYRHHDQDALNELFMGNWTVLPLRWNVIPPVYHLGWGVLRHKEYRRQALEALRHPAIVHYAGGYKPWQYPRTEGFNSAYYRYLALSGFRDVKMPQPGGKAHSWRHEALRLAWASWIRKLLS
ncbi:MAG: Glycosyltransferase family 8 protein [Succiniclasticum sp.]|jgi:lipopolysaccharide biosynthesis glycosyltransferase